MTKDNLEFCPKCGGDACYTTQLNTTAKNYFCFGCGFTSNDLMVIGEFDFEQYEAEFPELYKDIKHVDEDKRVWYPQVINMENQGTVFANGSSAEDWEWSGIKSIELTEEEKDTPKFKGKTHKSDSASLKGFGSDFFDACDYIGLFEVK